MPAHDPSPYSPITRPVRRMDASNKHISQCTSPNANNTNRPCLIPMTTATLTDNQHLNPSPRNPQTSYQTETSPAELQQTMIRTVASPTTVTNSHTSHIRATNVNHNNLSTADINPQIPINHGNHTSQRRRRWRLTFVTHTKSSHNDTNSNTTASMIRR